LVSLVKTNVYRLKGRKFGQTYFAINTEKAELENLNKYFRNETINKLFKD